MAESETILAGVPMLLEAARPRPSLMRNATMAVFISQLLAERGQLPPQRLRWQGSAAGAIGAYAAGAKIAVKRLPAGYRTSIVA